MKRVRSRVIAVAVAAVLGVAAAGCDGSNNQPSPGGSTPASATPQAKEAKAVLTETIPHFEQEAFAFTMLALDPDTGEVKGSGGSDPQAENRDVTLVQSQGGQKITLRYTIIGTKRFLTLAGVPGIPGGKWMRIDASKIGPNADRGLSELDLPGNAAKVFNAVVDAEDAGGGRYTGTIDLTRARESMIATDDDLTRLADRAKAVPFEATVDDQGRLTRVTLTPDPGKDSFEMTFTDWGKPRSPTEPPADEVTEAPSFVYEIFNP